MALTYLDGTKLRRSTSVFALQIPGSSRESVALEMSHADHEVGLFSTDWNATVENAIPSNMQGWKMQEWKMRKQIPGVEPCDPCDLLPHFQRPLYRRA